MINVKPQIAFLSSGVLGGKPDGQGIPVIVDLVERLLPHFEIIYYSFQPVDLKKIHPSIRVRQIINEPIPGRLKYGLLALRLLLDHFTNRHQLLFAVSVEPAGYFAVMLGQILRVPSCVQLIALEAVAIPDIQQGNLIHPKLRKRTNR